MSFIQLLTDLRVNSVTMYKLHSKNPLTVAVSDGITGQVMYFILYPTFDKEVIDYINSNDIQPGDPIPEKSILQLAKH